MFGYELKYKMTDTIYTVLFEEVNFVAIDEHFPMKMKPFFLLAKLFHYRLAKSC